MRSRNRINRTRAALLTASILAACVIPVRAEDNTPHDGGLRIEDGTLLPMCECSDPRDPGYSNENSDILRFCVYVETDNDALHASKCGMKRSVRQIFRTGFDLTAQRFKPVNWGMIPYAIFILHFGTVTDISSVTSFIIYSS